MKNIFSTRRHKNPHNNEESEKSEKSFFSKENKAPFFHTKNATVQTKLTIGQPGDKYEKEADSMADAVVNNSSKPDIQNKEISNIQRESLATPQEDEKLGTAEQRIEKDKLIQEKPELQKMEEPKEDMLSKMEGKEEEGMINKKDDEQEEEGAVQTKSITANQTTSTGISQQIKSKSGKGRSMSKNIQSEMESSFRTDFSDVNIHTDNDAINMNKELGAQAFTHGKDVYFNSRKYNPDSSEGKRLLAHELTHVVQQSSDIKRKESIQLYRNKKAFNFNVDPDSGSAKTKNKSTLQEGNFNTKNDKDTKPWINNIYIDFDGYTRDDDNKLMPTGNLLATYHINKSKPSWSIFPLNLMGIALPQFIFFGISGSSHIHDFTHRGNFTVKRIEGVGYNDQPFYGKPGTELGTDKGEGPKQKYAKNLNSSMSYAIFFRGGEAIHSGSLQAGSHGCVHVDWGGSADSGDTSKLQLLNYHSVKGLTKVHVTYDPAVLAKICCERYKHIGKKKGKGKNPCDKVEAKKC